MNRKIISACLVIMMLITMLAPSVVYANDSSYTAESDFYISSNTLKEYVGDKEVTEINIPPVVNGENVLALGSELFGKCYQLEKVLFTDAALKLCFRLQQKRLLL